MILSSVKKSSKKEDTKVSAEENTKKSEETVPPTDENTEDEENGEDEPEENENEGEALTQPIEEATTEELPAEKPKKKEKKSKGKDETAEEPVKETKKATKEPKKEIISTNSFLAMFKDSKLITAIFKAIASIIGECQIVVTEEGFEIAAMDGSHICLVSVKINKADMDEFRPPSEKFSVGVNLEDLVKVANRRGSGDAITFSVEQAQKRIKLLLKPESKKKGRTFTVAMIDIQTEEISMESINAIEFGTKYTIPFELLDQAVKDAEIYSEVLTFSVQDDTIIYATEGSIGDMKYELEKDELKDVTAIKSTDKETAYAIQFLKEIIKIGDVTNDCKISFGQEMPLRIEADLFKNSKAIFILAPRVDEAQSGSEED